MVGNLLLDKMQRFGSYMGFAQKPFLDWSRNDLLLFMLNWGIVSASDIGHEILGAFY